MSPADDRPVVENAPHRYTDSTLSGPWHPWWTPEDAEGCQPPAAAQILFAEADDERNAVERVLLLHGALVSALELLVVVRREDRDGRDGRDERTDDVIGDLLHGIDLLKCIAADAGWGHRPTRWHVRGQLLDRFAMAGAVRMEQLDSTGGAS